MSAFSFRKPLILTIYGQKKLPLNGVIPEHNGLVRIKEYRQTWTLKPLGKEMTHVILEGYVDPGGSVPDWISNTLLIETPYKAISGLTERMGR